MDLDEQIEQDKKVARMERLQRMTMVHSQCVLCLGELDDPEDRRAILESVSRFLVVPVEPAVSDMANLLVQAIGAALQTYQISKHPADQQVTDGQGRESIVSLIAKTVMRYPPEVQEELRRHLVDLWKECYPAPSRYQAPSSDPSSEEPSSEASGEPGSQE